MRALDENIGILVNLRIQNEERFSKLDERSDMLISFQIRTDERLAKSDQRFEKFEQALLKIARKGNGNSS